MKIVLPWPDRRPRSWAEEDDALLRTLNGTIPHEEIANQMGRTTSAVRNRVWRLGIKTRDDAWTEAEVEILREAYASASLAPELALSDLAARLSRSKPNVCRKARHLGLTNSKRKTVAQQKVRRKYATQEEANGAVGRATKQRIADRGHPRGFAGRSHTDEARKTIAKKAAAWNKSLTADERAELVGRQLRAKIERYGKVGSPRPHGSWKAGWREIGGKRNYYRSRWEANYARYLEWLKQRGDIKDWEHEPETFWFEAIKRGVRSYLPDFRVWESDGSAALHEVKGWMDARSKTTLKRMAKYHPHERIVVIRERSYNEIARKVGPMIPDWESGGRADRP